MLDPIPTKESKAGELVLSWSNFNLQDGQRSDTLGFLTLQITRIQKTIHTYRQIQLNRKMHAKTTFKNAVYSELSCEAAAGVGKLRATSPNS